LGSGIAVFAVSIAAWNFLTMSIRGFYFQALHMMEARRRREVELEADSIGLRLMSKASYRPEAAVEYVFLVCPVTKERTSQMLMKVQGPHTQGRIRS
jgi:predicted Zn-dependent protease